MSDDEDDLFGWEAARRGKADGMGRVEDHANEEWKEAARLAVFTAAMSKPFITTEDVLPLIDEGAQTHDLRAMGPVMMRACKAGWIEKTYMPPVPSVRRHMSPLTVWKSMLYEGEAAA